MANNTHDRENIAGGSLVNDNQLVQYPTTEKCPNAHFPRHCGTPQVYHTRGEAATSTIAGPRGKHSLPDLEPDGMVNFAPYPRREHPIQRPLSPSINPAHSSQHEDAKEQNYAVKSSVPNYLENSSSLTHLQEPVENPNIDTYHDIHSSAVTTFVRSSNNDENVSLGPPVNRLQSTDPHNEIYEEEQVSPSITSAQGQQDKRTLTINLQERDDTTPTAAEDPPSPETIAIRSSSAPAAILYGNTTRPQVSNHRVTKASPAISSPRSQRSSPTPAPLPTSRPSRAPTEEDLLLLLMRRQRIRDQTHSRLLNNLHQLQAENQRLKKQGLVRDAELVDMQREWQNAVRDNHIREGDIRAFGEKYDKLKTWARDMHDAFTSTRAEGSRLNDEVTKLKSEREAQSTERNEMLEKIEGLAEPVRKFKGVIAELRATSIELENTQKSLSQAQREVQGEKLQNKAYVRRIEQLESTQELMNSRLLKQQEEIQSSMSLLAGLFEGNDYSFLHDVVVELADTMQAVQQCVATKEESSAQFSSLLDVTGENHAKLSAAINSITRAQAERQAAETKEMDELKAKHAAELAEQQVEADTQLKKSRDELQKEKAKFRGIETRSKNCQEELSRRTAELAESERNLSTTKSRIEQLQNTKEELKKTAANSEKARQDLVETIRQLEEKSKQQTEVIACLNKTSNDFEARIRELKQDAEIQQASIDEKNTKIVRLNDTCKDYEKAELQSQKALEDARDSISNLKSTIVEKESQLKALKEEFDSTQVSAKEVSRLQELVSRRDTEVQKLSKKLENHSAEVSTKQAELMDKQQQIEKLKEDVSRIRKETEKIAVLQKECDDRDKNADGLRVEKEKEIEALKAENTQRAEDLKPLSTLAKLLTKEEKKALDEKVVKRIKSMIQCLHEQDCNNSADENGITRPRRAANREARVSEEDIVVPNSQSQPPQHDFGNSGLLHGTAGFNTFIDENIGPITNIRTNLNMVVGSRPLSELTSTTASEDMRPATSNHEMLLRSSDTGSYLRSQTRVTVLVPASSAVSPMRTRQGSQIRHGTPRPQSSADGERVVNFSTPPAHPREVHPPNSAAKRRQSSEVPESAAKRRTVNMKNLEVRSSRHSSGSPLGASSEIEDSRGLLPDTRKSMGIVSSKTSARQNKTKNQIAKLSRKNSKSTRFHTQFTASPT